MQDEVSTPVVTDGAPLSTGSQPPHRPGRRWWLVALLVIVPLVAGGSTYAVLHYVAPAARSTASSSAVTNAKSLEAAYDDFAARGVKEFTVANKAAVLSSYSDLSSGFSFGPGFLDDATTQLHALGLAYLYHLHPDKKTLYRNELYLLALSYLDTLPSDITDSTFEPASKADKAAADVLLSYRDVTLSSRVEASGGFQTALTNAIKNLKLADISRLSSYKIVAYDFNFDDPQFTELTAKHSLYGAQPMMWVEKIDGVSYIMMMKDYAQAVIDGTKNSLTHEFIHTQDAFVRGETGHVVEERRAEYFSGDTSAYYDTKQLFIYLNVLGGIDGLALFDAHPTDAAAFFTAIYAKLGVEGGNALAFSWPAVYLNDPQGATAVVADEHNLDVVMQHALAVGQSDPTSLNMRLEQRFNSLVQTLGSKEKAIAHIETIGDSYGLPTVQDEFVKYLKSQGMM